jgi:hypothetical protein
MENKPKQKTVKRTLNQVIDEQIDIAIQKAMSNLPQKIESIINSSIVSILGLDYGGKQIDHCNGRWNMFQVLLEAEAKKDVLAIVKNVKLKFDFDNYKEAFQKEYLSHFQYQIKYHAKEKAEKMATAMIEKRINELVPKKIEIPK